MTEHILSGPPPCKIDAIFGEPLHSSIVRRWHTYNIHLVDISVQTMRFLFYSDIPSRLVSQQNFTTVSHIHLSATMATWSPIKDGLCTTNMYSYSPSHPLEHKKRNTKLPILPALRFLILRSEKSLKERS